MSRILDILKKLGNDDFDLGTSYGIHVVLSILKEDEIMKRKIEIAFPTDTETK